jgi:hypothetical protein
MTRILLLLAILLSCQGCVPVAAYLIACGIEHAHPDEHAGQCP